MQTGTIRRALVSLFAFAAALGFSAASQGQLCNCSCDATVPGCYGIAAIFKNESGGPPAAPNAYLTAGIGTIPPTSAEVRHANRFSISSNTTLTHVCVSLHNPSGPSINPCASGDPAYIFLAFHDATTGLPGGIIPGSVTNFTVDPCIGTAINHQLVAFSTPQPFPHGADIWVGVGYPTADVNIGHQGSRPSTGGSSAVWVGGALSQWYSYQDPALGSFNGRAPIIRAIELVRSGGRLDVTPTMGLVTDENGLVAQFDVHLAPAPPLGNVTVNISSTNPAEGQPLANSIVFTPGTYSIPQTVFVLGQDDPVIDGPQPYEINLTATSLDPCYQGARERVHLTNYDNDTPCLLRWTNISPPGPSPSAREGHAMVFDPLRNRVVLFGGRNGIGTLLNDTWEFDVANNQWQQMSPLTAPLPRTEHAMAFNPATGQVLVIGGEAFLGPIADVWAWNGAAWTAVPILLPGPPRRSMAASLNPAGNNVVVMGGVDAMLLPVPDVYESFAGGWSPAPPMVPPGPTARWSHAATPIISNASVLMFGGQNLALSTVFGDTWLYGPSGWVSVPGLIAPSARHRHSLTSLFARNGAVLFGGQESGGLFSNQTWFFDAASASWSLQGIAGPSARMGHAAVEIGTNGRVLLFGGRVPGSVIGDTWLLDDPSLPTIAGPSDSTVDALHVVTMAISYIGVGPFHFQWFHNGTLLVDGPTVSGSQTPILVIGPAQQSQEGDYWCEVTSACGSVAIGNTAFLDVLCRADFNGDGVVTVPDIFAFLSAWFAMLPSADFNNDSAINVPDIFAFLSAWFAGCP